VNEREGEGRYGGNRKRKSVERGGTPFLKARGGAKLRKGVIKSRWVEMGGKKACVGGGKEQRRRKEGEYLAFLVTGKGAVSKGGYPAWELEPKRGGGVVGSNDPKKKKR